MPEYKIRPIAHIESDFATKFGIPRQAGIVEELEARIVFEDEFANPDALRGIEGFSHLWLIWLFSENLSEDFSPTVRPPRLGGNTRLGVFATRSPFRPNSLALSCVRLLRVEKDERDAPCLIVGGADLMNGTPIFDIKPYIPYADCHPDALSGFAPDSGATLEVEFENGACKNLPPEKRNALAKALANDPRPRYHNDANRVYAMEFAGEEIKFRVRENKLTVLNISAD